LFEISFASGSQGLFLKKPPLDPAKTFYSVEGFDTQRAGNFSPIT
jgi:hypothetical protein